MRLQDLKYDFFTLPEQQQRQVFLEYYQKRDKDLAMPVQLKTSKTSTRAPKGKQITLTTEQLELLKKLKLI